MVYDEKSAVGADVAHGDTQATSTATRPLLTLPKNSADHASFQSLQFSPSQCQTPNEEYDPASTHPFSAFYSHPTTRTSFEQRMSESKTNLRVYEHDLEAGAPSLHSIRTTRPRKECTVWPGKHQLLEKSLAVKKSKGCSPFRNLDRKQKLWAKIIIALIIVGAAVGIGVGVSKAVGGGVWKTVNSQGKIGDNDGSS